MKITKPKVSEHEIQYSIVNYLRFKKYLVIDCDIMSGLQYISHTDTRRYAFINHHKKMGYIKGQNDIMAIREREILFVEVKTDKGKQSTDQLDFQARIESLGHTYLLWRSLDDCMKYFEEEKNEN